jgi:PAS domain S-box-containing protein
MKLQYQTWLIISVIHVVLMVTLFLILKEIILQNSVELERNRAISNTARILAALEEGAESLDTTVRAWAKTGDVRDLSENPDPERIAQCFPDTVFSALRLNIVVMLDSSGRPTAVKAFDLKAMKGTKAPVQLLERLSSDRTLSARLRRSPGRNGIVSFPSGPMLIACRPVFGPTRKSPRPGTLIVGRRVDPWEIERLAARIGVNAKMLSLGDPQIPDEMPLGGPVISGAGPEVTTVAAVEGTLWSFTAVRDLFGAPAFVLRVDTPAEITAGATATLYYVTVLLVAAGFIFGGITILLVDRSEEALRTSEEKYRSLFEQSLEGVAIITPDGGFVDFNDAFTELVGFSRNELVDTSFGDLWEDPAEKARWDEELQGSGSVKGFHWRVRRKEGGLTEAILTATARRDDKGRPHYELTCHDITRHKDAERRIKKALGEKELLLNELHHRVKNNLQVMTSLLALQSESIKDEKYRAIFKDAQSRIGSMVLVHENLHRSGEFAWVRIDEYVRALVAEIFILHERKGRPIEVSIDVDDSGLGIDTAVPCGLIINELISNAFEHAFPDGRRGRIDVSFRSVGSKEFELVVADDGIGLPEELDLGRAESFGLRLVNSLARQLRAQIEVNGTEGTRFRVRFAEPTQRKRRSEYVQTTNSRS